MTTVEHSWRHGKRSAYGPAACRPRLTMSGSRDPYDVDGH
jgi:hypothetical protein